MKLGALQGAHGLVTPRVSSLLHGGFRGGGAEAADCGSGFRASC
jgi:hypothetical protein